MAKYFMFLLLPVCLLGAVEQSSVEAFKVKRDVRFELSGAYLNSDEQLSGSKVHSREKRAARGKNSYIFLDNRSQRTAKLYWRDTKKRDIARYYTRLLPGQTIQLSTYEYHEWTAKDVNGRGLMMNNKQKVQQKANTRATRAIYLIKSPGQRETKIGDKYIGMMVVLDKAAADAHENTDEVKRYILTFMRLATTILQHQDLTQHGVKLHLVLSKLVLLNRDAAEIKLVPEDRENNLRKVCNYMNKIGNNGPARFDHKLFITKNGFGMGGYANTGGMCSQYTSCSMVFDHGFTSAFLVAHEVSHSLGMDDKDFGQGSGYVMSQMVDARFDYHRWSTYSQISLLENIRKKSCLNDKPTIMRGLPLLYKYPGVHFSLESQCHLEYNRSFSAWRGRNDPCSKLKCQMPPPYSFLAKTTGSPALDGSDCGFKKWCMSGTCTVRTEVLPPALAPKPPAKVDGGWGDWGLWSRCSRSCSTGVQTRDRICNKPRPSGGGRPCVGISRQVKMCDTRKVCPTSVSPNDVACSTTGRKMDPRRQWRFYDDSKVDITCTFERGACKWTNDKTAGLRKWSLKKGATPSSGTGPSVDHTLKTSKGQYVYFESSTPTKAKAVLSSPPIKVPRGCLEFWYHMWGDHQMGLLKVLKVSTGGDSRLLWKRSGNQGNAWHRQTVEVHDNDFYKIWFVAKKKASGYKSDIALDDITFRPGRCSGPRTTQTKVQDNPCKIKCKTSDNRSPTRILASVNVFDGTRCSTKTTTGVCYRGVCKTVGCENILTDGQKGKCIVSKRTRQQTVTKPSAVNTNTRTSSRLNCDFERNFCHWRNVLKTNTMNWYRTRQAGQGYSLQARRTGRSGGIQVATIASPEVTMPSACLKFSYRLSRKGGYARLSVKWLIRYGKREMPRTVQLLPATQDKWQGVRIGIRQRHTYRIAFEAMTPRGHSGIIAIDNIRFEPGKCSPSTG